jgi:hypothetical protein
MTQGTVPFRGAASIIIKALLLPDRTATTGGRPSPRKAPGRGGGGKH